MQFDALDIIDIQSPCSASWDAMHGDDRVRFCDQCRLNVYNLSEMKRAEALQLVEEREGRLCVRFYRRPDGKVLTHDGCRRVLQAARRRMARMVAAAATLLACFTAGGIFARSGPSPSTPTRNSPLMRLANWLEPEPIASPMGAPPVAGGMPAPVGTFTGVVMGGAPRPVQRSPNPTVSGPQSPISQR